MKEWTVLAYIVADHSGALGVGEHNIDQVAHMEVDNIMWAADLEKVNVAVQVDFTGRPGVLRVISGDADTPARTILPERSAGCVKTLTGFVDEVKKKCPPSERYLMLIWGHGGGPLGFFSDPTGRMVHPDAADTLTLSELTQVIDYMNGPSGFCDPVSGRPVGLDMLVVKSCCVSSAEYIWELRKHVDYVVSSQAKVPVRAWTYGDFFAALAKPGSTADVGKEVLRALNAQFQFAEQRNDRREVPYSLLALSKVEALEEPLRDLTAALLAADPRSADVRRAMAAARPGDGGDPALLDMGRLANALRRIPGLERPAGRLAELLRVGDDGLVVAHSPSDSAFSGVGIFQLPPVDVRSQSFFANAVTTFDYETLDVHERTGWGAVAFSEDPAVSPAAFSGAVAAAALRRDGTGVK